MAEVVIIGAGLTGLSVAYHLEQHGFFDYELFEKNERAGGLLCSEQCQGFTFDYTGHLLHVNDPYFKNFLQKVADLDKKFDFVQRKTGIFSHHVLTDYPFQMHLHGLPVEVIAECIEGFVRRATHIKNPQSFYDWVLKYFGAGIGKHFFFPYNTKLLACNLKKVHPSWTGRFVPSTSLHMLVQGALGGVASGVGYNSSFYYPLQGGIEFLIKKIQLQLQKKTSVNASVCGIDPVRKIVYLEDGRQESYRYLVSTMPLNEFLKKVKTTQKTLHRAAEKLLCTSVLNINLGFSKKHDNPMHWIYFPEKKDAFYRLGFWNNISASSVPGGKSAVYIELSGLNKKNSLSGAMMRNAEKAITETLSYLGLDEHDVSIRKDLFLPHAYVIYDQWRQRTIDLLLKTLTDMDIYSVGRYGAWKYASMQESVLDGQVVANNLMSGLINKRKVQATSSIVL